MICKAKLPRCESFTSRQNSLHSTIIYLPLSICCLTSALPPTSFSAMFFKIQREMQHVPALLSPTSLDRCRRNCWHEMTLRDSKRAKSMQRKYVLICNYIQHCIPNIRTCTCIHRIRTITGRLFRTFGCD